MAQACFSSRARTATYPPQGGDGGEGFTLGAVVFAYEIKKRDGKDSPAQITNVACAYSLSMANAGITQISMQDSLDA